MNYLFVYGSLRPGMKAWHILAQYVVSHEPASVNGTLFDTGNGWPALRLDNTSQRVQGSLVVIKDEHWLPLLKRLDQYEGVPRLFVRALARVLSHASPREVEALVYVGATDALFRTVVEGGDWVEHVTERAGARVDA